MPFDSLSQYAQARDQLLDRLVVALQADERVAGAWLSGSFGRGEADEWADYDLHVAIYDEHMESFLGDRLRLYESLGQVALIQDEIPGQPDVGRSFHLVSFAGAIEVDWSFIPASRARKPIAHRLLFKRATIPIMETPSLTPDERRAHARRWALFFWAMAPIAIKYASRGETRRASSQVGGRLEGRHSSHRLLRPCPWPSLR